MPYSIWLVPREGNPFTKTTQELISDTVPRQFIAEKDIQHFPPHVTLTSDIDPSKASSDPQKWLDGLSLPEFKAEANEVIVELDHLEAEDPHFRKMNLAVNGNANLRKLAAAVREQAIGGGGEEWASKEYRPHLSLFYGHTPTKDVQAKIPLIEMKLGFAFGDLFACCGGTLCMGGFMVLVDTGKPVAEWKDAVVAKRETPWVMWRASRGLL